MEGSSLLFGKHIESPKRDGENEGAYEDRVWRERLHVDSEGFVVFPVEGFKRSLETGAKGKKTGNGRQTLTDSFLKAVVSNNAFAQILTPKGKPIKADSVEHLCLFVPSKGERNGPKRVAKNFPCIPEWKAAFPLTVLLDDLITMDAIKRVVPDAGLLEGIGSMRAGNGNNNGRYELVSIRKA